MSKRCMGCMQLFNEEYEVCPHCGYVVGTKAEEAIHMDPGTLLNDRYIIGKVLGYGGFGVTYIGWDGKLEQKVAIKEYLPGEFSTRMPGQSTVTVFNGEKSEQFRDGMKKFIDEAKRLAKFKNEDGIVKIFDSFEENDTAYIIMEYLDGETLTSYLQREKTIPEDKAISMLMPVMRSLQTVHAEGLLHRDIAPDNIFLTKTGEVKLIDFGASRFATTSHSRSLTVIIKPGFSPEEQYRSRGDQGAYTDVYALAATMYKMITGTTPPDAIERRMQYETKQKDVLIEPHKLNKDISLNRENALLNALNVRIEDRTPDIKSFIHELNADPPVKRRYGKIKKIDLYSWPLWLKITVPSALAAIVLFFVLLFTGVINFSRYTDEIVIPSNTVIAPDVEGLYPSEAFKLIEESGLLASTGGNVESEYITAGKIVFQTPVGGSYLRKNGTVILTVSSGGSVEGPVNGIATVPYVEWSTKDAALANLNIAGLGEITVEERNDENVTAGQVISQSIADGTKVDVGTPMTIVVSLGPSLFEVPNVEGIDIEAAKSALIQKGLVVHVEYEKSDEVEENHVIRQSVRDAQVKRGDEITIYVSSGKNLISVEDVVKLKKQDAVAKLEAQGFDVKVVENYNTDMESGVVYDQEPKGKTSQVEGAEITIYVSKGNMPITVKLNPNGGNVSSKSVTVYYSLTYGTLPVATRSGYTFVGWYTSETGGTRVTADTIVTFSSEHTLYARWTTNGYTVKLDPNGGSVSTNSVSIEYGAAYGRLPDPVRAGYVFLGWYTSKTGGDLITASTVMNTNANHTLFAHWSAGSYVVTFNANGGSVSTSSKYVTFGATYGSLPTPTRTGYSFDGWYTASTNGTRIIESSIMSFSSNVTLYAHWNAISYTVSFNANGGTVSPSSKSIAYDSVYGTLPIPSRDYYSFDGWYTASSGGSKVTETTTLKTASNQTLYAHWTENQIKGWTLASNIPTGAKIVEEKWTYTRTQTKESTSSSLSGWTQTGFDWKQIASGTHEYASFPANTNGREYYRTSDTYYQKYNGSAYSSYENSTTKRTVSASTVKSYIYYHWSYPLAGTHGEANRHIGSYNGENLSGLGKTTIWESFEGDYIEFNKSANAYQATGHSTYSYWWHGGIVVYTQTYTDYQKFFKYKKVTYEESTTEVKNGGEISDVQHYVKYREK